MLVDGNAAAVFAVFFFIYSEHHSKVRNRDIGFIIAGELG